MTKTEKIIDMDKESKRLDREAEKYMNTHNTMFVCPYCNDFLIPWSWYGKREHAKVGFVFQYTCNCNKVKRKDSPSWYEVIGERGSAWSFFNGMLWNNPSKFPIQFNPSVR
jgi:hypothetical protein